MLSNAYFLAKFRFDTAENEPAKKLQNFAKSELASRPGNSGARSLVATRGSASSRAQAGLRSGRGTPPKRPCRAKPSEGAGPSSEGAKSDPKANFANPDHTANLSGRALGCIEADCRNQIQILQDLSRSTKFTKHSKVNVCRYV